MQESPDCISSWELLPHCPPGLAEHLSQLCCELTDACATAEQRLEAALELKRLAEQPGAAATAECFLADLRLLEALLAAAAQACVDAAAATNSAGHLESSLYAALAGLMSAQPRLVQVFLSWAASLTVSGPAAGMAVKFAASWLLKSPSLARRCPPGSRPALLNVALRLLKSSPSVRFALQLLGMAEAAVLAPLGGRWAAASFDEAELADDGVQLEADPASCIGEDPGADDTDDPLTGVLAFLAEQLRLPRTQHCLRLRAVELARLAARRGASRRQLASGCWPVLREGLRPRRGQLDADLAELSADALAECAWQLRLAGVDEVTPVLIEFVTCGGSEAATADGLASAQLVAMVTADRLLRAELPACATVWVLNSCAQLLRWCLARRAALARCLDRLCLASSLLDSLLLLAEAPVPPAFAKDARILLRQLDCEDALAVDEARSAGSEAAAPPACGLLSLVGRLRLLPLSLPASERPVEAELLTACLCRLLAWAPGLSQGRRLLPRLRLALRRFVDVADVGQEARPGEFTGSQLARVWLAYAEFLRRADCLGWRPELPSSSSSSASASVIDDDEVDEQALAADCWRLMQLPPEPAQFDFRLRPFATLAEALAAGNRPLADAVLRCAARSACLTAIFTGRPLASSATSIRPLLMAAGLALESVCAREPDRRRPLRYLSLLVDDLELGPDIAQPDDIEGVIEAVSGGGADWSVGAEFSFEVNQADTALSELALLALLAGLGYWLCLADRLQREPADLLEPPGATDLSLARLRSAASRLASSVGQVADSGSLRFARAMAAQPECLAFALRGLCQLRSGFADIVLRRLLVDDAGVAADQALDSVLDFELASGRRRPPPGLARAVWLAFLARPVCPAAAARLARLLADPAGPGPDRRLFRRLAGFLRLRPAALAPIGRLLCDLLDRLAFGSPAAVGAVADLAFLCTACLPAQPFPALLNRCLAWLKAAMPPRRFDCLRLGLLLEPRVAGLLQRRARQRRPVVDGCNDELQRLLGELMQVSVATWKAAELREPAALRRLETAVLVCASAGLLQPEAS